MRMKVAKIFLWLQEYRVHCCIALLIVAGLMWMQRSETKVVLESALSARDVTVKYVGPLEAIVSRTGVNHGSTHLDAGFGIGIDNDIARDDLMKKLRPVLYVPFAPVLDVGREQASVIEKAGPFLRVGLFQGAIITADSPSGPVFTYQDYAEKIEQRRNIWMMAALLVAATSIVLFVVTRRRTPLSD